MGIVNRDDVNRERNRIAYALLELANQLLNPAAAESSKDLKGSAGSAAAPPAKRVLFICSSPTGPEQLNFGREFKKIETARQLSDHRDDFAEIKIKMSVEASDFVDLLTKYQPDILHIALHGSKKHGLYFEDAVGKPKSMSADRFARTIELYHRNPRVERPLETIVMNVCNSLAHAEAVLPHVTYAIGMQAPIYDRACAIYADKFYRMLFEQEDIGFAHERAIFELEGEHFQPQEGVPFATHEIPVLLKAEG
jgi:hypothetical protein